MWMPFGDRSSRPASAALLRRAGALCFLCACLVGVNSCGFWGLKEQQDRLLAGCRIAGTVRAAADSRAALVVILLRQRGSPEAPRDVELVDHFVLDGPGAWAFTTPPGRYRVTAYEDRSADVIYQPDEPALPHAAAPIVDCEAHARRDGIALVIPSEGRFPVRGPVDIAKEQPRLSVEERVVSLGRAAAVGDVTTLADPRFSSAQAQKGLWRPFDFMAEGSPGLYFLERYRAGKIPVLFVHGIGGTPREFAALIAGLDQRRFQPWLYYYPSGIRLEAVGAHLAQTIQKLHTRYRFPRLVIVAHSMGGLVARKAILGRAETAGDHGVTLFVSIASPWDGDERADFGVRAPTPVWAWYDLVPGSDFLTRLFYARAPGVRRRLPPDTAYHLMFTFVPGQWSDGSVSLHSQLRPEAQAEAAQVHGMAQTHAGVLRDPATAQLLSRLLAGTAATVEAAARAADSEPATDSRATP